MTVRGPAPETLDCHLCIIGAGYAALNGLNAAAKYLPKGARVVLVDKLDTWGGQWTFQYDFVRLHQPYQMFTAGDQKWRLAGRPPEYLATRREVLDHLASVPRVSAGHLDIQPVFAHAYTGHRVRDGRVEIDIEPAANGHATNGRKKIRARRLLKATGSDIHALPPFPLSSDKVRSVGVADPILGKQEFLKDTRPVYIIGSGKTAMDLVRHIVREGSPGRRVHVLLGSGMWFLCRDTLYRRGLERYYRGILAADLLLQVSRAYDGANEAKVVDSLVRAGHMVNVFGSAANCRLGMISHSECDEIRAGVTEVHRGHLVDVDGITMTLSEGKERRSVSVEEGSWFVNCTTHLRPIPHEAILQEGGIVCAPQFAMGFSGTSAYYVTHLWFQDQLAPVAAEMFRGRLDVEPKLRFLTDISVMVMANLALAAERLPFSIPARFEGDFGKWYPLHRQIPTIARVVASRRECIRKAERVLKMRFSDPPDA